MRRSWSGSRGSSPGSALVFVLMRAPWPGALYFQWPRRRDGTPLPDGIGASDVRFPERRWQDEVGVAIPCGTIDALAAGIQASRALERDDVSLF